MSLYLFPRRSTAGKRLQVFRVRDLWKFLQRTCGGESPLTVRVRNLWRLLQKTRGGESPLTVRVRDLWKFLQRTRDKLIENQAKVIESPTKVFGQAFFESVMYSNSKFLKV